jgi:hypothetical protein
MGTGSGNAWDGSRSEIGSLRKNGEESNPFARFLLYQTQLLYRVLLGHESKVVLKYVRRPRSFDPENLDVGYADEVVFGKATDENGGVRLGIFQVES